jgi:hypothetical protein
LLSLFSSSPSFLFPLLWHCAIGNSSPSKWRLPKAIARATSRNGFFDFSISAEDAKRERERERERDWRSSCCPISQNLFYQAPHIFEQALSEASLLSRLFVCLFACCCNCRSSKIRFVCFVFVCLACSSDLQLWSSCFFFFFVFQRTPS